MNMQQKLEILHSICSKEKGADILLERYGYNTQFPLNIRMLLDRLGIFVKGWNFTNIEHSAEYADNVIRYGAVVGAVAANDEKVCFYIDEKRDEQEQRWILAYLLAYVCLNSQNVCEKTNILYKTNLLYNSTNAKDVWRLASEIVMPEKVVRYVHTNLIVPLYSAFVNMFAVPDYVLNVRMSKLHLKCKEHV